MTFSAGENKVQAAGGENPVLWKLYTSQERQNIRERQIDIHDQVSVAKKIDTFLLKSGIFVPHSTGKAFISGNFRPIRIQ